MSGSGLPGRKKRLAEIESVDEGWGTRKGKKKTADSPKSLCDLRFAVNSSPTLCDFFTLDCLPQRGRKGWATRCAESPLSLHKTRYNAASRKK